MKFILLVLFALLFLAAAGFYFMQPRMPKNLNTLTALESYLSRLVASNNPPGISIAVVKHGRTVYRHSVGVADPTHAAQSTDDTVYHWWSMTKIATALGIMQLHEQGELDIDEPVIAYLPWFVIDDPEIDLSNMTIRQLLRHTSGLPDTVPAMIGWVHYEDVLPDQTETLKRLLPKYARLRYEPDQKAVYTNFGYIVLGAVIEEVSGKPYEAYIHEYILEPSGMDRTGFLYMTEMSQNEAFGSHPLFSMYTPMLPFLLDMDRLVSARRGMTLWFNRVYLDVTPSSGLVGSVEDAAGFMIAYMSPQSLLDEATKSSMQPTGVLPTQRPLGWAEYRLGTRLWLQHRGGGPGFATIMRIYPRESLGIVVMANGTNLPSEQIVDVLANFSWE